MRRRSLCSPPRSSSWKIKERMSLSLSLSLPIAYDTTFLVSQFHVIFSIVPFSKYFRFFSLRFLVERTCFQSKSCGLGLCFHRAPQLWLSLESGGPSFIPDCHWKVPSPIDGVRPKQPPPQRGPRMEGSSNFSLRQSAPPSILQLRKRNHSSLTR